jgi:poly(3-hydroxybutyrate) depolymerase
LRFNIVNLSHLGLCLVIWLCVALGSPALGRGLTRDYLRLVDRHASQASTYKIRVPDVTDPSYRIPVVVVLHDAGRSGASIIRMKSLVKVFVDNGYAVLAPNALPRRNSRIGYRGNKPTLIELGKRTVLPFTYSKKRFLMENIDGTVRRLEHRKDTGWYFYNIDRVRYSQGEGLQSQPTFERLGRDEIQSLRNVLRNAAEEFGIDPKPVLVIGLGHGGSLVWQIACYAPRFARILAPVGGTFWRKIPKNCKPGAHLVHTHHRASKFWPLKGDKGNRREYERTSIYRNLEMLLGANKCKPEKTTIRKDELGMTHTTWADCEGGSPVEHMFLDGKFAFQTWWLDEMLARIERFRPEQPTEAPEVPLETGPGFKTPGTGTGFKAAGAATGFKAPGAGTGFKRPDTGTASRFKRLK